jgi:hypothetical protein
MPRIFDNIEADLLPALEQTLQVSQRADFCVGYFNLRGWKELDSHVEAWAGGKENCCRLLVGMQRLPQEELRAVLSLSQPQNQLDNQSALPLKKKLAEDFRNQLVIGVPIPAPFFEVTICDLETSRLTGKQDNAQKYGHNEPTQNSHRQEDDHL